MPVCQFTIRRIAAEAIDIATVKPRARASGYERPTYEASTHHAGSGKVSITCSSEMATFFIELLTKCAEGSTGELRIACLQGAAAALTELQQPEYGMTEGIKPNRMG